MNLLSIFLWTAGAALIFGFTNAVSYARGYNSGWDIGFLDREAIAKMEGKNNERTHNSGN